MRQALFRRRSAAVTTSPAVAQEPPASPEPEEPRTEMASDGSEQRMGPFELPARPPDHELLTMGRFSYDPPRVVWYPGDTNRVFVGAYCSIHPDVQVMVGGNHFYDNVSSFAFRMHWRLPNALDDGMPWSKGDVNIGNDVYLGREAFILSGVTIGDGAFVGSRAVVTKDVRPYAIVVGNPGREVKRRFSDEVIEQLLKIRWWEWPHEVVMQRIDDLNGGSAEEFVERYAV